MSAIWAQKSRDFQGPPLPMAQVMNLPPIKIIKSKRHIKNRYICGNFMYMKFAAALFCILYSVFCSACCEFYVIFRDHPFQWSSPSPSLAFCTEQFRNQQRYEKCVRYASGTQNHWVPWCDIYKKNTFMSTSKKFCLYMYFVYTGHQTTVV